jgi:hypothetical protein
MDDVPWSSSLLDIGNSSRYGQGSVPAKIRQSLSGFVLYLFFLPVFAFSNLFFIAFFRDSGRASRDSTHDCILASLNPLHAQLPRPGFPCPRFGISPLTFHRGSKKKKTWLRLELDNT